MKVKRTTVKRARQKTGRDKFSHSFSLPIAQIEWLEEHPEISSSKLISQLLEDYIQTYDNVQPEMEKLIIKRRALENQLSKTETQVIEAERACRDPNGKLSDALEHQRKIQFFAGLPLELIEIQYKPNEVTLVTKNEKGHLLYESFKYQGLQEPEQVMTTLIEELKRVEGPEYQARIEWLKGETALPNKIYNTYIQKRDNINSQIAEINKALLQQ